MANSTVKIWLSLRMQTNDDLGGVTIFIRRYAIFFSEAFYQMAGVGETGLMAYGCQITTGKSEKFFGFS